MTDREYCTAYECALEEVHPELLRVCADLGSSCEHCSHRCAIHE